MGLALAGTSGSKGRIWGVALRVDSRGCLHVYTGKREMSCMSGYTSKSFIGCLLSLTDLLK